GQLHFRTVNVVDTVTRLRLRDLQEVRSNRLGGFGLQTLIWKSSSDSIGIMSKAAHRLLGAKRNLLKTS
ncbi:hypothetical protein, partial [Tetzosporium hominis]|uniref:hypothetical protein n=1 Tax=Tetzosporium hominis TaxID=2020506 RepID=UPI001A9C9CD0